MAKITGDNNANQLLGTTGKDIIQGLGGNDYIYGNAGADQMIGGAGDDQLDGATNDGKADTILGGAGDDRVSGMSKDILDGGAGHDYFALYLAGATHALHLDLTGLTKHGGELTLKDGTHVTGMESGSISFGMGRDVISTGDADVDLYGGGGDDRLTGGKIGDILGGGAGDDILDGGKGSDWASYIGGGGGAVEVHLGVDGAQDTGAGGMDTLISIENLIGSGNDDTLFGDGHANSIEGSSGADTITGGGGADTFVYTSGGESYAVAPDQITDLSDDDTIDLHGIDADTHTLGDQDFTLVSHFTGHAGQAMVSFDGTNTRVDMDTNGDGSADEGIIMQGDHRDFDHFIL